MRVKIIASVCCGLFFIACGKPREVGKVSVDTDPKRVTPDSVAFGNREIVILETSRDALLSDISALDIYGDNIYVLDQRRATVFVFGKSGEFISSIGRQGRGPGEYGQILSFCIDRDSGEMLIATDNPNRIMYYSLGGEFLGETEIDDLVVELLRDGDRLVARVMDEDHDLAIYEMDGHAVKSVEYPKLPKLQMDRHRRMSPSGSMLLGSRHGVLFTRSFDNTLYKVDGDRLIPWRTLDFGGFWQDGAGSLSQEDLTLSTFEQRNIYAITNAKFVGRNRVIFNGSPNGVFVLDGNAARHYGSIASELSLSPFGSANMIPILDPRADYVAFTHSAMEFSHLNRLAADARGGLTEEEVRLSAVGENDNPVIFLYKLSDAE